MSDTQHAESTSSSRRDFLKSAAAAGAAVATGLSYVPYVHAAGSDMIKVGLVGCGGRGSGAAENVLHSAKNVEIVAIGDVFKKRVDSLRSRLQSRVAMEAKVKELGNSVKLTDDSCHAGLDAAEKVINDPNVNYIILATPPGFRPPHLELAVAAKKNIFTEKPVGVDGPGIRKVLDAFEKSKQLGLHIVAGTQRRHQLGYLETLKKIHDGAIGDIVSLRCYWNQGNIWFRKRDELHSVLDVPDSDLAFHLHNWYHFVWTCGDHIVEQHVHNLDVCNWAKKGHPKNAVGMGGRDARQEGDPKDVGHIWDNFAIDYDYGDGVHMLSQCRQINGCANSVSEALVGTKGFCDVNAYTVNKNRLVTQQQDRAAGDPYVREHTDLIESIRTGKPLNELQTVAESTLTAIMGRMSSYTGKRVTWEQALGSKEETMPPHLSWTMSIPVPAVAVPGKTVLA
jgi:predicted dehydrogenase